MKLLVNRAPRYNQSYGGGNAFLIALWEFASAHGVTLSTKLNAAADVVFMFDPRADELGIGAAEIERYKLFHTRAKVVQRVNECDLRKGETDIIDPILRKASGLTHHTFWVSDWMKEYHLRNGWNCESHSVLVNGVAPYFKPYGEKHNNGLVNIVSAHWSSNKYKGQDVYEWLDRLVKAYPERFSFTYIGRTEAHLPNSRVIEPLFGEELARELSLYDVYVTGTRADPGPNHCAESISCGLPTYAHFQGGGACEFVGQSHVFHNEIELSKILSDKIFPPNETSFQGWESVMKTFFSELERICSQ